MKGSEKFEFDGKNLDYDMLDFWRFHYSNIYDIQGRIAEFIVCKALDIHESQNDQYWTLWDLTYRGLKIEVKETSYYHSFNKEGKISKHRSFGITKANGAYDPENSGNSELRRQNDVYVFCLNTGYTKEEAYPLNLNNWEFYIVPTTVIDEKCGNNKTISLNRIKKLGYTATPYDKIKDVIDAIAAKHRLEREKKHSDDFSDQDVVMAHRFSNNHKKALEPEQKCGCFYCLSIFNSSEIEEWLIDPNPCDRHGTALCPKCDIDSVIGESSGYPITSEFLKAMNKYWFGNDEEEEI